ncbi:cytokine-dependent hematopoietic cell linker [Solea solea]|uniref:cytokine-dependent hematopoietic cell linker n=1 Tax=Solea solea TaxID=90069 RepID=UPI00272ACC08|nr:cytokine-dependent hematopoietic cell linker [Solea solea]XP_058506097.1 cytokine-dependent hematopoietic cell linker [Solea solea]
MYNDYLSINHQWIIKGLGCSSRCSPSPPPSELDSVPGLTPHKPCWRNGQERSTQKNGFSSQATGPQSPEPVSDLHINHRRHFLDQDTRHIDSRSRRNPERAPEKHHHHEWPQTKRDFDQHDFVPKEKPQQMSCEEDWYIRACNRADAEHALHLVNKDGAFLVRDCSVNTNSEPLVLSVYHEKKVYNVKIRFIESAGKYVLGTGQRSNDMFDSVADIIKFHTIFPIILISGRNLGGSKYAENCVLTYAVTRKDVNQLLQ